MEINCADLTLSLKDVPVHQESVFDLLKMTNSNLSLGLSKAVLATKAYLNEVGLDDLSRARFCLDLLEAIGKNVLSLSLATEFLVNQRIADAGVISSQVAKCKKIAPNVIGNKLNLEKWLLLGKGMEQTKELSSIIDVAFYKLLGAKFLDEGMKGILVFLSQYIHGLSSSESNESIDWKTLLQETSQSKKFGYPEYKLLEKKGTDHSPEFYTRARVGNYVATGYGKSKKKSEQDAARKLIEKMPSFKHKDSGSKKNLKKENIFNISNHKIPGFQKQSLSSIERVLKFEFNDKRLLSLALIHPSFVNESKTTYLTNRSLATLGSYVLALYLRVSIVENFEEWWPRTVDSPSRVLGGIASEKILGQLGKDLGLINHLLVGKGQSSNLTDSMSMEVVQACFGAMYLDVGYIIKDERIYRSVFTPIVHDLLNDLAGFDGMIKIDPATLLQEVSYLIDIHLAYEVVSKTGPPQSPVYVVDLTLTDGRKSYRFKGRPSSKEKYARHNVATLPLKIVSSFPEGIAGVSRYLNLKTKEGRGFLEFLLNKFIEALKAGPAVWEKLSNLQVFGANDISYGSREDARKALKSLWEIVSEVDTHSIEGLGDLIRRTAVRSRVGVREQYKWVAQRVASFLDEFQLDNYTTRLNQTSEFRDLLAISALGARIESMTPKKISGKELALIFNSIRELEIVLNSKFNETTYIYGDIGHFLELLYVLARELKANGANGLYLSLENENGLNIFTLFGEGTVCQILDERFALFGSLATPARIKQFEQKILIEYPSPVEDYFKGSEWVEEIIHSIFDSVSHLDKWLRPFASAAHDLKNLFLAIDGQLENASQDQSRRFQYLASAENSLNAARVSARNLLLSLKALPVADYKVFSFSELLKDFVSGLHRRIPNGMTLYVTQDSSSVNVLGDEHLLRAALENLCKNAIEAVNSMGILKIEWVYDSTSNMVLLEISDNGPGLSDAVLNAFLNGVPAPTNKQQGSGLGLLSAQNIVKIHGGELTVRKLSQGTAFTWTLPARPNEVISKIQAENVESLDRGGDDES